MWSEITCAKLQLPPEPLTRGLLPTDPRSLCPLSSTEFVDPLLNKILGYAIDSVEMFSAYTQEVNLSFIILNIFYLRFCYGPDVRTGNFSVKICGVMPLRGSIRNIILLHTQTILSQNFTNNFFLHTTRSSHATF